MCTMFLLCIAIVMLHQDDCPVCAPVVILQAQAVGCQQFLMLGCVACSWVVITALSALVCTGAVLGFVFLRGFVPSPYDAITISNSGSSSYAGNGGGYAGNNGYRGYALPFLFLPCHNLGNRLMWGVPRCMCLSDPLSTPPPLPTTTTHRSPCTFVLPVALQNAALGLGTSKRAPICTADNLPASQHFFMCL